MQLLTNQFPKGFEVVWFQGALKQVGGACVGELSTLTFYPSLRFS